MSEWRAARGARLACVWLRLYMCIQAPLVRVSTVRLSDQHGDGVCFFFVRSLIFSHRWFTSCSLGKLEGLSQSLFFSFLQHSLLLFF